MSTFDPKTAGFKKVDSVAADSRGRVTLSKQIQQLHTRIQIANGRFNVYVNDAGQIVLDPTMEIPVREQWIYKNPKALKALQRGLASAVTKPLVDAGSFAKYADDDVDE